MSRIKGKTRHEGDVYLYDVVGTPNGRVEVLASSDAEAIQKAEAPPVAPVKAKAKPKPEAKKKKKKKK